MSELNREERKQAVDMTFIVLMAAAFLTALAAAVVKFLGSIAFEW